MVFVPQPAFRAIGVGTGDCVAFPPPARARGALRAAAGSSGARKGKLSVAARARPVGLRGEAGGKRALLSRFRAG